MIEALQKAKPQSSKGQFIQNCSMSATMSPPLRLDLKAFIKDTAKSTLDGGVKNGDLTQKQEDNALSMLDAHLDRMIDGKFFGGMGKGFPFGGHGRGHHMGPNGATPGTSDGMGMMEGLSRS